MLGKGSNSFLENCWRRKRWAHRSGTPNLLKASPSLKQNGWGRKLCETFVCIVKCHVNVSARRSWKSTQHTHVQDLQASHIKETCALLLMRIPVISIILSTSFPFKIFSWLWLVLDLLRNGRRERRTWVGKEESVLFQSERDQEMGSSIFITHFWLL